MRVFTVSVCGRGGVGVQTHRLITRHCCGSLRHCTLTASTQAPNTELGIKVITARMQTAEEGGGARRAPAGTHHCRHTCAFFLLYFIFFFFYISFFFWHVTLARVHGFTVGAVCKGANERRSSLKWSDCWWHLRRRDFSLHLRQASCSSADIKGKCWNLWFFNTCLETFVTCRSLETLIKIC